MRHTTLAVVAALAASATFAPAPAGAESACGAGDSLAATCQVLDSCATIGALGMTQPPNDAVTFYRNCLFTDHKYRLLNGGASGELARSRSKRPAIYVSTYWPLYCQALQRAGQSDPAICSRRLRGTSGAGTTRPTTRHRRPRFTG